jgi:hypothetical protein
MSSARKYENLTATELREMFLNGALDADSMTVEDYEKLFDYESELDIDNTNSDVLNFCSDGLGRFEKYSQDDDIQPPPIEKVLHKRYVQRFQEINKTANSETSAEFLEVVPTKRRLLPLSRFGRIAAMFVSIITVAALIGHGVAVAMGYDNILDLIRNALNSPERTATNVIGQDAIFTDNTRIYNSMTELLATENLDILYPTSLPEGYGFTDFIVLDLDTGLQIQMFAIEPFIEFIAYIGANFEFDNFDYEVNDIRYSIDELGDGLYQGHWLDGADYYTIVVKNRESLSEIINNLTRE